MKRSLPSAALGVCLFSAIFYAVTAVLLRKWFAREPAKCDSPTGSVTFLRPIKGDEPGLEEKLRHFFPAVGPADQVIFGIGTDADEITIRRVADAFPGASIDLVRCDCAGVRNPKVAKLIHMEPLARNDLWIVIDSDTMTGADDLAAFRSEWQTSGADAISSPYAFTECRTPAARWDALATQLSIWPGAALLRATGRADFLTGACMGICAATLRAIGGWDAFRDSLAEDYELSCAVRASGGRVHLASTCIPIAAGELRTRDWILHQHRVYATYRLCNPAGTLGLPLTHGVAASLLFALARPRSLWRWVIHLILLALRVRLANALPRRGARPAVGDVWIASMAEPAFWFLSWLPLPVRWSGRWLRPARTLREIAPCGEQQIR